MLLLGPQPADQRVELPGSLELEHTLLGRRLRGRPVPVQRVKRALTLRVAHRVAGDLERPPAEAPVSRKRPICSSAVVNTRLVTSSHVAGSRIRNRT
jgi:hypothetical protein